MCVWTRGYSWGQWGFRKRGEWREHWHTNCWDSSSLFCNSVPKSWTAEYSRLKTGGFFFRKPEKPKKKDPKDTEIVEVLQRNNPDTNLTYILRLSTQSFSVHSWSKQPTNDHLTSEEGIKTKQEKATWGCKWGREVRTDNMQKEETVKNYTLLLYSWDVTRMLFRKMNTQRVNKSTWKLI